MSNSRLWSYADAEVLPAPVDYHEVRGHLRIGTVSILDKQLASKLATNAEVSQSDDIAIRYAVRDSIQMIASLVGDSPNALHYLFWNLFRTYCVRTSPLCRGEAFNRLPRAYAIAVESTGNTDCPFRERCNSADQPVAINEHKTSTEYY